MNRITELFQRKDRNLLCYCQLHGSQRKSTKIVALISVAIKSRSKNFFAVDFRFSLCYNATTKGDKSENHIVSYKECP